MRAGVLKSASHALLQSQNLIHVYRRVGVLKLASHTLLQSQNMMRAGVLKSASHALLQSQNLIHVRRRAGVLWSASRLLSRHPFRPQSSGPFAPIIDTFLLISETTACETLPQLG